MRGLKLAAIAARRFRPNTTDSRHRVQVSPNLLLEGKNMAHKPGQVIIGDITYLPMRAGIVELSGKFARQVHTPHRGVGGG